MDYNCHGELSIFGYYCPLKLNMKIAKCSYLGLKNHCGLGLLCDPFFYELSESN